LTGPENERKLAGQPEKSAGILNEPPQNQGREQLPALRLARYFNTTPDYWINMQAQYDLETARDEWDARIQSEVRPRHAA
jgi:hypothetical protein